MKRDALHLAIGILCGLLLTGIFRYLSPREGEADLRRYGEVRDFVRANYVREVSPDELVEAALHGMIERLDPYSRYLDRSQIGLFERETGGRYKGIGVVFRQPLDQAQVLFTLPGSPADRAGLAPGDRLVAIDGRPIEDLGPGKLQEHLLGADGETLELGVLARGGAERTLHLERADVVDPTVRHARMIDEERGIGYLAITSFSHETSDEFDRAVEGLRQRGLKALVIDVRGNPGGVLVAAVRIVNRFVAGGVVVSTEGRGEPQRYEAVESEARWSGMPLCVLADQDSASASEVLAGALQDWRAAALVGSPTYGKGMVQKVKTFGSHEGAVKLTSSYYYTPAHRNIERSLDRAWEYGLLPDLAVEISTAQRKRIHAHLSSYGPPDSALPALREWEAAEGRVLIEPHPEDPQLDAALALIRGERPVSGANPAEGKRG